MNAGNAQAGADESPANGTKILLVDDRAANLLALEAVLAPLGCELVSVESGADALRELQRAKLGRGDFAVMLLDVHMPEMDGFETASRIRQLAAGAPHVPIIFVTATDGDRERVAKAHEGGAVDFVQKPFDAAVLRAKVAVFVDLHRVRQKLVAERAETHRRLAASDARLQALSDLAIALARVRSRDDVAAVVVEHGMRASHADTCTLYVLDEAGTGLELVGERGVAAGIVDAIRRISETEGTPGAFAKMKAGTALWAESEDDYRRIFPAIAAAKVAGRRVKAFWSVPLIVEGRSLGLLGMGFYEARRFLPEERSFVETFAKQCAQALVRAWRLEREDEARGSLATTLRSIGDAVIATDHRGHVTFMNPIAERLTGWLEGEARGRALEEVFHIVSYETKAPVESPVTRVLREGKIVHFAGHTLLRSRSGVETPIDDSAAPIRGDGARLFGVVLVFRDVTKEKRDRVRSEFLAKAGEALVSSLDYAATLATVARFAVPALADWCTVDLVEPGGSSPRQVTVAHVDPAKVELARWFGEKYPLDPNATRGVPEVVRSGKPELYAEISPEMLAVSARDAEHLKAIRELRLESAMIVPLRAHGRTLGAITFIHAGSGRRYAEDDLAFAEEFARRAALAIENAFALRDAENARALEHSHRAAAEAGERMFRELVENLPELAWTAQPDGHVDFYNRRWFEFTGTTLEEMRGWGWRALHDPDVLAEVELRWRASLATGLPFEMEYPLRGKDGVFRWFLTRVRPFRNEHGDIVRWFGTNTDIDERRRHETFREVFVGILGHDLRNPLSTILMTAQMMTMRKELPPESEAKLKRVMSSGLRMQRMIEQILDMTRARIAGGILITRSPERDLVPLVTKIVDELRAANPQRAIRVQSEGPCLASVDGDRLEQVLSNLLANAVAYGDPERPITVVLKQDEHAVRVAIHNYGPPIPASFMPLLFNPFARSEKREGRSAGLGLGLYISERIVVAHGGTLVVESSLEGGTKFEATLPRQGDGDGNGDEPDTRRS